MLEPHAVSSLGIHTVKRDIGFMIFQPVKSFVSRDVSCHETSFPFPSSAASSPLVLPHTQSPTYDDDISNSPPSSNSNTEPFSPESISLEIPSSPTPSTTPNSPISSPLSPTPPFSPATQIPPSRMTRATQAPVIFNNFTLANNEDLMETVLDFSQSFSATKNEGKVGMKIVISSISIGVGDGDLVMMVSNASRTTKPVKSI
ncbi:hypothetical protein HHK36_025978 [Tetracentron sinense]|uniref:Uncharacterized protein n=1 Tax=Tetracentron sinense TaxID=13715 RepID=A0A834YJS5_TETSI|nr:hypothetical protein HHK36_025978 [Tetracentron sinense]